MEDLWKDMALPSTTTPTFPPTTTTSTTSRSTTSSCASCVSIKDFLSPPQTELALNFALCCSPCPNTAAAASAAEFWSKKRTHGGHHEAEDGITNRRQTRMNKNRESAARSRARKQAYTRALEQKIVLLAEENARLKSEHEEFLSMNLAMATQVPKTGAFRRASTAPL